MTHSLLQLIKRFFREITFQPPFPVTIQADESECGLASLTMALASMGCSVDLEDLRHLYGSTRGGMTVRDLTRFASTFGLRMIAQTIDRAEDIQIPSIIFVRGEHFAFLWKRSDDGNYCVADPSDGNLLFKHDEFLQYYSGVSLSARIIKKTFNQFKDSRTGKSKPSIIDLIGIKTAATFFIIAAAVVSTILTLSNAIAQDVFMTYIVEENEIFWTKGLIVITIAIAVLLAITGVLMQLTLIKQLQKAIYEWNTKLFGSLFNAPYSFFCNKTSGLIASRFNQIDEAVSGFQSALLSSVIGSLNLLTYVITVSLVSMPLMMVSLVGILGFLFVGLKFYGLNIQNNYLIRNAECEAANAEFKLISSRDQIILENSEVATTRELNRCYALQSNAILSTSVVSVFNEFFLSCIDQLLSGLLLVVSALLITQGEMTTGVYAAISVIIQTALAPVRSIAAIIETIQNSRLSFNTAAELYQNNNSKNEQTLQDDISSKKNSSVDNPILEVKNVSFRYSIYSDTIFDNANLSIRSRSNKSLAVRLDGGTGGGKSTLLNLLLGMQKCNSGSITIYGYDIAKLSTKDRNQLIQYIDRYPIIQAGSVAMNARLGSGASHKDYEKTILALGLEQQSIFSTQGDRYLDDSNSLSVGQAVMISLVRSALLKPSLLLIDESLISIPENLHQSIIDGYLSMGISLLIVQHGMSQAIDQLPTVQLSSLQTGK